MRKKLLIMWKEWQIKIVESYKQDKTIKEIADAVGKSEAAVKVYMYRKGIAVKKRLDCPILQRLIMIKFADVNWFKPDRAFYEKVKISQKRFSALRMGYAQPTAEELIRVASVLKVNENDLKELYKDRQLSLFPEN